MNLTRLRRWLNRLIVWPLLGILTGVLLLLAAFLGAVGTETGLKYAIAQLQPYLPGQLTLGRVQGHLLGTLRLEAVQYENGPYQLHLEQLQWRWQPQALLQGRIQVEELTVEGVTARSPLPPAPPPAEPPLQWPLVIPEIKLPLEIWIQRLALSRVQWQQGEQPPLLLDNSQLALRLQADGLHLEQFAATAPQGEVKISGQWSPQPPYPLNLDLSWRLTLPDGPPLQGSGFLTGQLGQQLQLQQTLTGAVPLTVHAILNQPLTQPAWQVQLKLTDLQLQPLNPKLPPGQLSGELQAQGNLQDATLQSQWDMPSGEAYQAPWHLQFNHTVSGRTQHQPQFTLTRPQQALKLTGSGQLQLDQPTPQLDLQLDWSQLQWPLQGQSPQVELEQGKARIQGTTNAYQLTVDSQLKGAAIPQSRWQIQGTGNTQSLTLQRLHGDLLAGTLDLTGLISWAPQVRWDVALAGKQLNPGLQWPQADGSLSFNLLTAGQLIDNQPELNAELTELAGVFRQQPVSGQGQVAIKNQQLQIKSLKLKSGKAELNAQGELAQQWNLDWKLAIPALGVLIPQAAGDILAQGHLGGTVQQPTVDATVRGKQWRYQAYQLDKIAADVFVDVADKKPAKIRLNLDRLAAPAQPVIDQVQLALDGQMGAHRLTLEIKQGENPLRLAAQGGYALTKQQWQGELTRLAFSHPHTGSWKLTKPTPLQASAIRAKLQALCLQREQTQWCTTADWQAPNANLALQLQQLPLAWLKPWLPGLDVSGHLSADLKAQHGLQGPMGTLVIHPITGQLHWKLDELRQVQVPYQLNSLQADLNAQEVQAAVALQINQQSYIKGQFQAPRRLITGDVNTPLSGELHAQVQELGLISAVVAAVESVAGQLQADLKLAGTLGKPQITGTATLEQGGLKVPAAGLEIAGLQLQAQAEPNQTVTLKAVAQSGQGEIRLDGTLAPDAQHGLDAQITLQGHDFQVVDLPEVAASLSPDLTLRHQAGQTRLQGTLTIPKARIEPKSLPDSVQTVSSDEEMVGAVTPAPDPAKTPAAPGVEAEITLALGDQVLVNAFGLKARLAGQINVNQRANASPRASGEFNIADKPPGQFKAYGQNLLIRRGRVYFSGALETPGLDIEAIRKSDDNKVIAGVRVVGSAAEPVLQLFSEPALDQTDALAYLMTGRSFASASGGDSALMADAASTMGSAAAGMIGGRVGKSLGMDTVEVEGGATAKDAALVIGKYLNPKLYVSYGMGLFKPIQIARFRYQLSPKWAVQGDSSTSGSGGDLLYVIEIR